jgi:hypothetical protein
MLDKIASPESQTVRFAKLQIIFILIILVIIHLEDDNY